MTIVFSIIWLLGTIYCFNRWGWASWKPWVCTIILAQAVNPYVTESGGTGSGASRDTETCAQYAGTWTGSGNYGMGLANAAFTLDANCDCKLVYDHSDYRLDGTEYGSVVQDDYGYQMHATNGGKYEVYFQGNSITVSASDFTFTMY
jgi:hypothetical protein